ncbi:hypothetical protein VTL71DRAFT_7874 [Oculimacula yallundae]|uniref:Uncharacterized protein n=1 Tax=Oculimacula yallundae TaxID=86028 RepID=A0ABR4CVY2_9HELO
MHIGEMEIISNCFTEWMDWTWSCIMIVGSRVGWMQLIFISSIWRSGLRFDQLLLGRWILPPHSGSG